MIYGYKDKNSLNLTVQKYNAQTFNLHLHPVLNRLKVVYIQ